MNTQSPLVPQGIFLEQRNKGRARVKIAVFVVLAIHGIGLLALLMQGCKKEPDTGTLGADQTNTNTAPAFMEPTNTLPLASNPATSINTLPEPVTPPVTPPAALTATEYKVVAGDNFTTIARKFHVTTKAITDANPGVDSAKLRVGQTLHIPAPAMTAPAPNGTSAPAAELGAGEQSYTVQSGDTLTGIATKFKVTVKALRSANSLTTDRIRVGQKLKIPAAAPATGPTSAPPAGATTPSGQ